MTLHVIAPGLMTTVQDCGRWGWQSFGVPVAGPMDPYAHRRANALVGNDVGAATLEATLLGPELAFEDERTVAVTGAAFELAAGGRPVPMDEPFLVPAGSRLRFGQRTRGARAYVAVSGGIDVPPLLGSRATHVTSVMGGFDGRPLRRGDRLPLGQRRETRTPAAPPPIASVAEGPATVRVLPGPQLDAFAPGALDLLQSEAYIVGNQSDRMGFRLEGPTLVHSRGSEIISDATPHGSLQVPGSGQPILLMADRQTTGGYPKIATVITADLGVAGQLAPGDALRFVICSMPDALAALVLQERALMAIEGAA
jgi:antagonist of KipI